MSKLGLHYQVFPEWAKKIAVPWAKMIDPGGAVSPLPQSRVIGRLWVDYDNAINAAYIARGAAGAEAYFQRCLSGYRNAPWIHCWEGANEPAPLYDASFALSCAAFLARWVDLMHAEGLKTAVGSFGVGWPGDGQAPLFREALIRSDYLAVHEYAAPTMRDGSGFWTLRYRKLIAELKAAKIRIPPILITECGIDGGVLQQSGKGYKDFGLNEEQYQKELAWYDTEISKDGEVLCATPFTCGPKKDWLSFEVTEKIANWVVQQHIIVVPPVPPPVFTLKLFKPVPPGSRFTQGWGENPAYYGQSGLPGHNGLDWGVPEGTTVTAAHDGVFYVGAQFAEAYGTYCWVYGKGFRTLYGHGSKLLAKEGQPVLAGQPIMLSGNTGHSTGPHLHLGLQIDELVTPGYGKWDDPTKFMVSDTAPLVTPLHDLAVALRWTIEESVREMKNMTPPAQIAPRLLELVDAEKGIAYRLERALEGK